MVGDVRGVFVYYIGDQEIIYDYIEDGRCEGSHFILHRKSRHYIYFWNHNFHQHLGGDFISTKRYVTYHSTCDQGGLYIS